MDQVMTKSMHWQRSRRRLIEIDLSESPYKNDMIHNRWHPDIPMVAWVKPGDDFVIQTYDWTGGFIQNNESADDVRDIDLIDRALPVRPDRRGRRGARRSAGGRSARRRRAAGEPLGLQRLLLEEERRRLPHRSFPGGAEIDLGYFGHVHAFAPRARRQLRRPHPSRPDRLPAGPEAARHLEQARESAFIATDPNRVPPLAEPPFAATAHAGRAKGDAKNKVAAEGARTVPPREHGGNCDIKDLSRGSKIYFPVYVKGAGLSMGDLHFSQGDGEITFCGAIEMAGWLHLKVEIIKDGVAKYGIKNPIFKPSPITPNYNDYLIFEGISVDEAGKQHYLDVHIAYRQACLNAIEYLTKFGYTRAQAYSILGTAPCQGHISGVVDIPNACATLWLPTEIFDFDIMPSAAGPIKHVKGGVDDAAVAGQVTVGG